MPQRLFVDRGALVAYLALSLAACSGAPGAVVPVGTTPVSREQVSQWVTATLPPEHRLHRFKWLRSEERRVGKECRSRWSEGEVKNKKLDVWRTAKESTRRQAAETAE